MYTHTKQIIKDGLPLNEANKVIIMLHGRGGSARDMISLKSYLHVDDMAIYAPQANLYSWYPYSFLAPEAQNQPALDSALEVLDETVEEILAGGISSEQLYFLGFSQGACLTLEYVGRHARKYAGVIAFTGGLIGEELNVSRYQGDFQQTPILITTGDPDPHVPLARVEESVQVLEKLGADIQLEVYKQKAHSISREELDLANKIYKIKIGYT